MSKAKTPVEIPAGVHVTYKLEHRKCNKLLCTTCKTSAGHGPYTYAYWRENGATIRKYIGRNHPEPHLVGHIV